MLQIETFKLFERRENSSILSCLRLKIAISWISYSKMCFFWHNCSLYFRHAIIIFISYFRAAYKQLQTIFFVKSENSIPSLAKSFLPLPSQASRQNESLVSCNKLPCLSNYLPCVSCTIVLNHTYLWCSAILCQCWRWESTSDYPVRLERIVGKLRDRPIRDFVLKNNYKIIHSRQTRTVDPKFGWKTDVFAN